MGQLWIAIFITIIASTSCSVGKALQKEATRQLPRFSKDWKILQQYVHSRVWLSGLAADLGGGILQIFAFALAPVSVVQPVSGIGLVGLSVYSHLFLKEKLQKWEWAAVVIAGIGALGLGATSSDEGQTSAGLLRILSVFFLASIGVASFTMIRKRRYRQQRRPGDKATAALYGLQAGGCFGLSAVSCRIGFVMRASSNAAIGWMWPIFGLSGSIFLSSVGFILQTVGLKEGNTVIVCTCAAVASMATGVLVGMLGLGEHLPPGGLSTFVRLLSWTGVFLGVAVLANGAGGLKELVSAIFNFIPAAVWNAMPVSLAVKMKTWATHRVELPEISTGSGGALAQVTLLKSGASSSPHRIR